MQITSGLMEGQVLQRNRKNQASAVLCGECAGEGAVEVRVQAKQRPLKGWNWKRAGKAVGGRFEVKLAGIPAGGPYRLECRVVQGSRTTDRLTVREWFVGDVWFLGGQSNMQGIGNMADAPKPHPLVRAFYMRDEWGLAVDPLHILAEAVDPVHNGGVRMSGEALQRLIRNTFKGVTAGVYFGREMVERTGVPQGLVCCAHGGTSMDQWNPELRDQEGKSLYGAMVRRFHKLGQPVRGILWYQGESDASEISAQVYTEKMEHLVAASRRDFNDSTLPWVVVQIGRVVAPGWTAKWWNVVQEAQRRLPERIKRLDVVPSVDLNLDDGIHISGRDFAVLANRLARVADRLAMGNRRESGGIQPISVKSFCRIRRPAPAVFGIEVVFSGVSGELRSAGRPVGFTAVDPDGKPYPVIFKTELKGNRAYLYTVTAADTVWALSYGSGCDPVCNVTDAQGMGVPVFGPLSLSGLRGSAFLVRWKIRGPFAAGENLSTEPVPPSNPDLADWRTPFSVTPALVMPQDVQKPAPGWFCFRTAFQADAERTVMLSMGADSPYKVWLNGAEVACNKQATNPCNPDEYRHPVTVRAGRNDLVVLFDGRNGMGWGIAARFLAVNKREELPKTAIQELQDPQG